MLGIMPQGYRIVENNNEHKRKYLKMLENDLLHDFIYCFMVTCVTRDWDNNVKLCNSSLEFPYV